MLFLIWKQIEDVKAACERSPKLMGAEEVCWSSKVKLGDRIQYTTKSVLNFAKEKLGLSTDEPYYPQEVRYYLNKCKHFVQLKFFVVWLLPLYFCWNENGKQSI